MSYRQFNLVVPAALFAGSVIATLVSIRATRRRPKFRIVSLCPSTTQTLFDLGLGDCVIGRTTYCTTPEARAIHAYGGTKNPKWDKIRAANPTHILFNLEENDYTQLPQAEAICQTLTDTPVSIEESKEMVLNLGEVFGASDRAQAIAREMEEALERLGAMRKKKKRSSFTYLYFIWHKPARRVVGKGTYIGAMLEAAGGVNLALSTISESERYPLLPDKYGERADYCFLSTEPFHFQEKHIPEYDAYGHETLIIDGEMLSWHGSRTVTGLLGLAEYFGE